ncbi:MAG: hypothetical protein QOJ03_1916 [Frankiaceae bacterium]|jgi:hypothetical protein|nr:hypothetical protein [Frankiaceae bacterium]
MTVTSLLHGRYLTVATAFAFAVTGTHFAGAQSAARPTKPPVNLALPAVGVHQSVRIVASRGSEEDAAGQLWMPDADYAVGGRLVASSNPIARTSSPWLYQRARKSVRGYNIPVTAPGSYFVDLYVAETHNVHRGARVWDVRAEGHTVAKSVDVVKQAGLNTAWHVLFFAPVTDRTLNLRIVRHHGKPIIAAVQVDYHNASPVARTLFHDGFNGPAGRQPSGVRWRYAIGGGGYGNHELQTYTKHPRNVAMDGQGHLFITARKEWWRGPDGITRHYTSARINTSKRFSFKYGTAEARIDVPGGKGMWPAFWTLGGNVGSVGWPLCGEMDIMEAIGRQPMQTHGTVHGGRHDGGEWTAGRTVTLRQPVARDYHIYGMVWGPSAISMLLDGRPIMTVSRSDLAPGDVWFNHTFFLVLNLAVGGDFPHDPTKSTPFPAIMAVDYVRVTG